MAQSLMSWNTLSPNNRRFVFLLVMCVVMELLFRFVFVIDGMHFYNVPQKLAEFLSFFEPCFPVDQAQRLAGLIGIVRAFHKEAERIHLKYWIEYGSLLGSVRDGKIIAWDIDADVGVFRDDFLRNLPAMRQAMERAGYQLKHAPAIDEGCRYVIYPDKARWPELKVDVYLHVLRKSDNFVIRCGVPDVFRWQFPAGSINPTEIRKLEGSNVRAPRGGWKFIRKYRYPSATVAALPYKFWCWFYSWRFFFYFVVAFCLTVLPLGALLTWCCWRVGRPTDCSKV